MQKNELLLFTQDENCRVSEKKLIFIFYRVSKNVHFFLTSQLMQQMHCVINKKQKRFFLQKKRSKILLSARASLKH